MCTRRCRAAASEGNTAVSPYVGVWDATWVNVGEEGYAAEDANMEIEMDINEDGTIKMISGESGESSGTWKEENGQLIVEAGEAGTTLQLNEDGELLLIDEEQETTIFFEKR